MESTGPFTPSSIIDIPIGLATAREKVKQSGMPGRSLLLVSLAVWALPGLITGCGNSDREPVRVAMLPSVTPQDQYCEPHRSARYSALYGAKAFSIRDVGEPQLPGEVRALRCVTLERNALEWLQDIAQNGTVAGQLYALVGIRALDKPRFDKLIVPYISSHGSVTSAGADIAWTASVSELAADIAAGGYAEEFLPQIRGTRPPDPQFVGSEAQDKN